MVGEVGRCGHRARHEVRRGAAANAPGVLARPQVARHTEASTDDPAIGVAPHVLREDTLELANLPPCGIATQPERMADPRRYISVEEAAKHEDDFAQGVQLSNAYPLPVDVKQGAALAGQTASPLRRDLCRSGNEGSSVAAGSLRGE